MGSKKSKNRKKGNKKNVIVTNKTKVVVMSGKKNEKTNKKDFVKINAGHKNSNNEVKCDKNVTKVTENAMCFVTEDGKNIKNSNVKKTIADVKAKEMVNVDVKTEEDKNIIHKYTVKGPNSYTIKPMVERKRKQNTLNEKNISNKKNKTKKSKSKIKNEQIKNSKTNQIENNKVKSHKLKNDKVKTTKFKNSIKNSNDKIKTNIKNKNNIKNSNAKNHKVKNHEIINKKIINNSIKINKAKVIEFVNKYKHNQWAACIVLLCVSLAILGIVAQTNSLKNEEVGAIRSKTSENYMYGVFVNGIKIGIVDDKETIENACTDMKTTLKDKYKVDVSLVGDITYVEDNLDDVKITKFDELYTNLKQNLACRVRAYSIYSGEKKVGSLLTEAEALEVEENVKNYFTEGYDPENILSVEVSNDVKIIQENIDFSEIRNLVDLTEYAIIGTDEKLDYIVESGDNYWSIAYSHDMTLDELFSANPEADENYLMPDDVLSLIVPVPLIDVEITREVKEEEAIPYDIEETKVSYLYTDQSKVQVAGVNGVAEIDYIVTERNGMLISKEEQSRSILTDPTTKYVLIGTQAPPAKIGTGTFINPLSGSYVSSRFGNRYIFGSYSYHTGIDLAKAYGSTISATDGGTVTFAGYKGSYGYMVEIDHGGGYTSRYAHCGQFYVSVGEKVYQGQAVASVGLTGVTTGPHCHFEIRKYGIAVNPAGYIY